MSSKEQRSCSGRENRDRVHVHNAPGVTSTTVHYPSYSIPASTSPATPSTSTARPGNWIDCPHVNGHCGTDAATVPPATGNPFDPGIAGSAGCYQVGDPTHTTEPHHQSDSPPGAHQPPHGACYANNCPHGGSYHSSSSQASGSDDAWYAAPPGVASAVPLQPAHHERPSPSAVPNQRHLSQTAIVHQVSPPCHESRADPHHAASTSPAVVFTAGNGWRRVRRSRPPSNADAAHATYPAPGSSTTTCGPTRRELQDARMREYLAAGGRDQRFAATGQARAHDPERVRAYLQGVERHVWNRARSEAERRR